MPCTHPLLYVRDAHDACVVLEAVRRGILPLWTKRLDPVERQTIQPGNIFVWEEAEEKGGLERWTDGRRWTQSRMRLDFLFYEETIPLTEDEKMIKKNSQSPERSPPASRRQERPLKPNGLAKQTISMLVNDRGLTKRWHLVAYTSLDDRRYPIPLIDQYEYLRNLKVPEGVFLTTRGYPWTKKPVIEAPMNMPFHPDYEGMRTAQRPQTTTTMMAHYGQQSTSSSAGRYLAGSVPQYQPRVTAIDTNMKKESSSTASNYTPLTPEDKRALDSFNLRL